MTGEVQSSGSRKLAPWDRRRLQRSLALGDETRSAIARQFGVSASYVTKFARQYSLEIDTMKRDLANEFAGLWIADKASRIVAYQQDYQMAVITEKRDHHEWIKCRTGILHAVAEELGQLPPRATITVIPVTHIVENVDLEALQ